MGAHSYCNACQAPMAAPTSVEVAIGWRTCSACGEQRQTSPKDLGWVVSDLESRVEALEVQNEALMAVIRSHPTMRKLVDAKLAPEFER